MLRKLIFIGLVFAFSPVDSSAKNDIYSHTGSILIDERKHISASAYNEGFKAGIIVGMRCVLDEINQYILIEDDKNGFSSRIKKCVDKQLLVHIKKGEK